MLDEVRDARFANRIFFFANLIANVNFNKLRRIVRHNYKSQAVGIEPTATLGIRGTSGVVEVPEGASRPWKGLLPSGRRHGDTQLQRE